MRWGSITTCYSGRLCTSSKHFCESIDTQATKLKEVVKEIVRVKKAAASTSEGIQVPVHSAFDHVPERPKNLPHIPSIDDYKLQKAIEYATTKNSLKHFFENNRHDHGFNPILDKMGGREKEHVRKMFAEAVVRKLFQSNKLPECGKFEKLTVEVAGQLVECKGFVHEGILKMGTMFIRSKF